MSDAAAAAATTHLPWSREAAKARLKPNAVREEVHAGIDLILGDDGELANVIDLLDEDGHNPALTHPDLPATCVRAIVDSVLGRAKEDEELRTWGLPIALRTAALHPHASPDLLKSIDKKMASPDVGATIDRRLEDAQYARVAAKVWQERVLTSSVVEELHKAPVGSQAWNMALGALWTRAGVDAEAAEALLLAEGAPTPYRVLGARTVAQKRGPEADGLLAHLVENDAELAGGIIRAVLAGRIKAPATLAAMARVLPEASARTLWNLPGLPDEAAAALQVRGLARPS